VPTEDQTGGPEVRAFDPADAGALSAPFTDLVGLEIDLLSPDRFAGHLDVTPAHHQPYGIVHGGVYATLVETAASLGAAANVNSSGKVVVGVNNSTDFLRAHREGRLDVVATPIHTGRIQQLWQVEITREDGKMVARGQVRLQVLDPEQVR